MAQQPKVNKETVKTLVVQYGQREAARQAGLSENTVKSWSLRYGWKQAIPGSNFTHPICTQAPGDALSTVIESDNRKTRAAWSTAARKAAEHFAKLKPSVNTKKAIAAKNWHSVAAGTHSWDQKSVQSNVMVSIALLGVQPEDVRVSTGDASARTLDLTEGEQTD